MKDAGISPYVESVARGVSFLLGLMPTPLIYRHRSYRILKVQDVGISAYIQLSHLKCYPFLSSCPHHPSIHIDPIALGNLFLLGLMPIPSIYRHTAYRTWSVQSSWAHALTIHLHAFTIHLHALTIHLHAITIHLQT